MSFEFEYLPNQIGKYHTIFIDGVNQGICQPGISRACDMDYTCATYWYPTNLNSDDMVTVHFIPNSGHLHRGCNGTYSFIATVEAI